MKAAEHIKFWVGKVLNIAIFIVIPIIMVGWVKWLIGFPVVTFTTGLATALVFQLAHTVEGPEFPMPEMPQNVLPDEFAIHQLSTTANFATNSRLVTWLVGGLNFQIEHHLFPSISHVHYRAISPIVRQVCEERNISYVEHRTFGKAVGAHLRHLRAMGRAPEVVPPARNGVTAEACNPGLPVGTT
jgi:linoleoyl-CoA desaturase